MAKHDLNGRYWARIKDVVPGSRIKTDMGSDCWVNYHQTVRQDADGLYFLCKEGRHGLDGQRQGDHYVGIYQIK